MKKTIRRLRLREGDIVVVKDLQTLRTLEQMGPVKGAHACPIVFAPEGIKRCSREYIDKLLSRREPR